MRSNLIELNLNNNSLNNIEAISKTSSTSWPFLTSTSEPNTTSKFININKNSEKVKSVLSSLSRSPLSPLQQLQLGKWMDYMIKNNQRNISQIINETQSSNLEEQESEVNNALVGLFWENFSKTVNYPIEIISPHLEEKYGDALQQLYRQKRHKKGE